MTVIAKVIADSISAYDNTARITTFELEYPRLVHSEFMTHRVFSRNSASSRAIPIAKVIEQVELNPAMPSKFGKNKAGMQAEEDLQGLQLEAAKQSWLAARDSAVSHAKVLMQLGLHKQVVNRVLEPFQHIKVVMTTTQYMNWNWLREHKDADPTIYNLAVAIEEARNDSTPIKLSENQWHLPYVKVQYTSGKQWYFDELGNNIDLQQAIMQSCSCAAQVSYRKLDTSIEKAVDIYMKLIESEPVHASAFEHVATPVVYPFAESKSWDAGVTHEDKYGNKWSGNFRNWVQYRQLIPNNAKHD